MDEIEHPAIVAHRRALAEQRVRDQVLAQTYRDLPTSSLHDKLEASHFELMSTASPLAFVSAWRA